MNYVYEPLLAAQATQSERAVFIRRTYAHVAGAVLAFAGLLMAFFILTDPLSRTEIVGRLFGNQMARILLLVAFIGGGYLAQWWANSNSSSVMQYLGLALYVLLEVVIFIPLMVVAVDYTQDQSLLPKAAIMTLALFGGLSAAVFTSKKDFSFLGPIISIASFLALGLLLAGYFFGFGIGLWFSFAMVALASAAILYSTSNVIHHYRTDQYVAAALSLFAAVAFLFYYILMIFLGSRRD